MDTPHIKEECKPQIRLANLNDIEAMYRIEVSSFKEPYPKALLQQLVRNRNAVCLIIEDENKIKGFAVGLPRSQNIAHIITIAIDPHFRKCNFGNILLSHLLEKLKDQGMNEIKLELRVSNSPALKLYEKFGFHIIAVRKRYYYDGEDAYLMSLTVANLAQRNP